MDRVTRSSRIHMLSHSCALMWLCSVVFPSHEFSQRWCRQDFDPTAENHQRQAKAPNLEESNPPTASSIPPGNEAALRSLQYPTIIIRHGQQERVSARIRRFLLNGCSGMEDGVMNADECCRRGSSGNKLKMTLGLPVYVDPLRARVE